MQYIFILGNNPELSRAEIRAVLPDIKVIENTDDFLIGENKKFNCHEIIDKLGGTVKIGKIISDKLDKQEILEEILKTKLQGKIKFGLSFYNTKPDKRLGMEIKKALKEKDISSRLVVSRDKVLSSVVVAKNKCLDFIITSKYIGLTCAVQDFEKYSEQDYGRPKSNARSGMIPPKLAKMMINLSRINYTPPLPSPSDKGRKSEVILDPFCGSGTILSEAMVLGYGNLIGSDISEKAIKDTQENLNWLKKSLQFTAYNLQFFQCDIKNLSDKIKPNSIDAIITEPYLGPALRGKAGEKEILKIKSELEKLYLSAFEQFKKVLKKNGQVVMVWPIFSSPFLIGRLGGGKESGIISIDLTPQLKKLGFKRLDKGNLIYKREGQKIWREIIKLKVDN